MPKIALYNMFLGFAIVAIAAMGGVFNAYELTDLYLKGPAVSPEWQRVLSHSAHGHTNLFGILHIIFGLTMPYSKITLKFGKTLTIGLSLGAIAMGPLLLIRAAMGPTASLTPLGVTIGLFLACALSAIMVHAWGLWSSLTKRSSH